MQNSCDKRFIEISYISSYDSSCDWSLIPSGFIKDCFSWNFGEDASKTLLVDSSLRLSVAGRLRITCFSRQAQIQRLDSHLVKPSAGGHQAAWNELLQSWYNVYCSEICPFPSISHHIFPYLSIIHYVSCHIVPHLYLAISFHVSPYLPESLHVFHLSISCHISPYLIGDIGSYRILSYLTDFDQYVPTSEVPYFTRSLHILQYLTISDRTLPDLSIFFIFSVSWDIFHLSMSYHILPYILLSAIHLRRHVSCFQITCEGMWRAHLFADHLRRKIL